MVAVILAVAITVTLAAVLYVLVLSLTHTTSGTAPLGSEFAWGSPSNDTAIPTNGCATTTHYCYNVEVLVTGTTFHVTQMMLGLRTAEGTTVAWPSSVTGAGGTIQLIAPSTASMVAQYWPGNATWQLIAPFSGQITSDYSLVIYCGGAAEGIGQGLLGFQIVAVGAAGYSGTVYSSVFP